MFHYGNFGFERLGDGSVRIVANDGNEEIETTFDADSWASVVSGVSAYGDHAPHYFDALNFHWGGEEARKAAEAGTA
jgi:hypothetical protein